MNIIDYTPIIVSLKLAFTTTFILLLFGIPLAWWLSQTNSKLKLVIESIIALPLVLPPTVLGFYLLILMSPQSGLGKLLSTYDLAPLAFSFPGLVIGSIIYSMPFVIQPIQNSFAAIPYNQLAAAKTLGAGPIDQFFSIVLPMSTTGIISATILGFAHTVGEFGVVLMIGGSIPGNTKVLSIAIYDHVEALQYDQAHILSGGLLLFSFLLLLVVFSINKKLKVIR